MDERSLVLNSDVAQDENSFPRSAVPTVEFQLLDI